MLIMTISLEHIFLCLFPLFGADFETTTDYVNELASVEDAYYDFSFCIQIFYWSVSCALVTHKSLTY